MRIDYVGLMIVVALLVGSATSLVFPLTFPSKSDRGDGLSVVVLDRHSKGRFTRPTLLFSYITVVTIILIVDYRSFAEFYGILIRNIDSLIIPSAPTGLDLISAGPFPVLYRFLVAADLVALAIVIPAPIQRKLTVLWTALLYGVFVVTLDALLTVFATSTHLPIGPISLEGVLVDLIVATIVYLRVVVVIYQLPKPTNLPLLRPKRPVQSAAVLLTVGFLAVTITVGVYFLSLDRSIANFILLLPLFATPTFYNLAFVFFFFLGRRPKRLDLDRFDPINVIMPAFNESESIATVIDYLDKASKTYPGQVYLIVADDGSSDHTVEVTETALSKCESLNGVVLRLEHAGKAAALNSALRASSTEIVVRIDADTYVLPGCFTPLAGWFHNPEVGMVGALSAPRTDRGNTWFQKMRNFEELRLFGFNYLSLEYVDSVSCVPGTFTAFRREPAMAIEGFVEGMNGEDSDFTMQFGRLGYQVVFDTNIRILEDVPVSLREFREQRVRWNRAALQTFFRHSPLTSGNEGPRVWFSMLRNMSMRGVSIMRGAAPIALLALLAKSQLHEFGIAVILAVVVEFTLTAVVFLVLAIHYKRVRLLPWIITWPAFLALKRIIQMESLFTLPLRDPKLERTETQRYRSEVLT